ncbi:universal stress protein [Roseicyclus mahoneyensis]|uniref:Nucleotide-binding universal stress UspA family protein n=1 Tax=Roseicyclus mahoneyensis TaxID=164332 RepID=A0A316GDN5_9RHOB|nr:universal stress protein [Roseicyclus mahoneyensis]PWK59119.1 nucleotide-binding universal stress UspA family protein [Roseicyclus mahoneyensis]
MRHVKSILAVLTADSLSDVALARAVSLAQVSRAALTLVDVIDGAPGELGRLMAALTGQRGSAIEEDVIAFHRARLSGFAKKARAQGIEVTEAVLQGSPFLEVIRMVLREGHDVVIKGATLSAEGRGTLKGFDMHLLRKCPCPVWLLMAEGDTRFARVLATIDPPGQDDPARDSLDHQVLGIASDLAVHDGADLQVLHAWSLPGERALRQGRFGKARKGTVDSLIAQEETAARARVMARMSDHPQVPKTAIHMQQGIAADVIAQHAEASGVDAIVMGTVGRTGVSGFVMGTTAETILRRVSCAVIAVKPDGFVSPVTLNPVI